MGESIRRRIETLEAHVPQAIILTLNNGGTFNYPGSILEFYTEGMKEIAMGGGPILNACGRTVSAKGCGRFYELMRAVAEPLIAAKKKGKHVDRGRSRSAGGRRRANVVRAGRNVPKR